MAPAKSFVRRKGPSTLTAKARSKSSHDVSSSGASGTGPSVLALWMTRSIDSGQRRGLPGDAVRSVLVADVGGDGERGASLLPDGPRDRLDLIRVARHEHDPRPGRGEAGGERPSEPPRSPGDQRRSALDFHGGLRLATACAGPARGLAA